MNPDLVGRLNKALGVVRNRLPTLKARTTPQCVEDITELVRAAQDAVTDLESAGRDAERYLNAVFAMADDGWLMHGPEGMSEAQEMVYAVAQEHPEYKRRIDKHQADVDAIRARVRDAAAPTGSGK